GDYRRAIDFHEKDLAIALELGDRGGEGRAYTNLGNAYNNLGDYRRAIDFHEKHLAIALELGDQGSEGAAYNNLGNAYRNLEDYPQATDAFQQALAIFQGIEGTAEIARVLSNIGNLLSLQEQPTLAIVFYKQSVRIREDIRTRIKGLPTELQETYTANVVEGSYRALADLLLQQDRILEAQRVLELLKLQELDDYLRGIKRDNGPATDLNFREAEEEILRLYEQEQNNLIALGKELASLAQIPVAQRTDAQKDRIRELRKLDSLAREKFGEFLKSAPIQQQVDRLRRTTEAANVELDELNALRDNLEKLDQNAVVLYPLVLPDRLELVVVSANAAPVRRTSVVDKTELNRVIGQLRYALESSTRDAETPAKQLYDWLIRPIEDDLAQAGAETIIYAPDEQLRYIPLPTLHDGDQWLAENYRVQNITAASIDDLTVKPFAPDAQVLAAAFTEGQHQVQNQPFDGLTYAGVEVENLTKLVPQADKRLNQDFGSDIIYDMDDYQIVHLATHATFNPGPAENSFIVFGNGEHANLIDIERWSFPNVELIVLSACETAVGDVPLGDGKEILGFGYRMQNAGADAAIASLWSVDDGGTQLLMDGFYDALIRGGLTKAEALRQAQLAFITGTARRGGLVLPDGSIVEADTLKHPHYWAPFILIGNGL
ncbi:MAG: CHAT domain-containing protein, partial [Leptolyngbya sp. SIO3F4]|nr:CHAT domain-containing protein [Leptolyngbya sp. SIO3F4]